MLARLASILLCVIALSPTVIAQAAPRTPADLVCRWEWKEVRVSGEGKTVSGFVRTGTPRKRVKVCYQSSAKSQGSPATPSAATQRALSRCGTMTVGEAEKGFCALLRLAGLGTAGTAAPADPEALARQLAVYLRLPDTPPHFGPNPDNNEWKMLAVGYPVWLWVDGPLTKSTTVSASGLTFQLTARRTGTTFTMGDGTTLHCSITTRYRRDVTPGTPSPTCGHVYKKPSLPGGPYTVTATAHWTITWNVAGLSGTFPLNYSDSAQLRIGELQALVR